MSIMQILDQIKQAQKTLSKDKDFVKTPLVKSKVLSKLIDAEVFYKREDMQKGGSFKIRGAIFSISQLTAKQKRKGLLAASAGNHGIAVAIAAKKYKCKATIVVPITASKTKIKNIRKFGGKFVKLIKHGSFCGDAEKYGRELEKQTGKSYIANYNDFNVVAGQGTIGLELLKQLPNADFVFIPFGGGGLISGVSVALKESGSKAKIIAVQPEVAPYYPEGLKAGKFIDLPNIESIADALTGDLEDSITFDIAKKYVSDCILVSEAEIKNAIKLFYKEFKSPIEGSAAVTIAAVLKWKDKLKNKKVVAIISGQNIDKTLLNRITKG